LASKLIELDKNMKFSFQYTLWDQFKQIENFTLRKIYNLVKFTLFLILEGKLSISCIKVLELDERIDQHKNLFMRLFFKDLLEIDTDKLNAIFKKILQNDDNLPFRESLRGYIKSHYN
jgi:nucleolar MIF4G domain-containing protein 1